jgi:phage I-like protein
MNSITVSRERPPTSVGGSEAFDRVVCDAVAAPAAPGRVLLVPWGEVVSANGAFIVDDGSGPEILRQFLALHRDLVIDYEHQTLAGDWSSPDGTAPAAGWIKGLDVVSGSGIWGDVEWTDRAAAMITAKEYRYLSPVTLVETDTRRMVALQSVALTNDPAIVGMAALINKAEGRGQRAEGRGQRANGRHSIPAARAGERTAVMADMPMDDAGGGGMTDAASMIKSLRELFAGGASDDDLVAEIKKIAGQLQTGEAPVAEAAAMIEALAEEIGGSGESGAEEVASSLRGRDPAKARAATRQFIAARKRQQASMVPAAEMTTLTQRVSELESDLAERDCEALIQANSTRLPPAQREWFKRFYRADQTEAEKWLAEAPELVANKSMAAQGRGHATGPTGRKAEVLAAKRTLEEDRDKGRAFADPTSRAQVSGQLVANGRPRLTDAEAAEFQLVA